MSLVAAILIMDGVLAPGSWVTAQLCFVSVIRGCKLHQPLILNYNLLVHLTLPFAFC